MKLLEKQKRFANEYIESGNAYQSALKAGYSDNYAKAQSSKLLENVGIKSYIASRVAEIDKAKIATQKEILEFATKVMRRQEFEKNVVVLKKPTIINVQGAKEEYEKIVNEEVAEVVEIENSVSDALRAADLLSKIIKDDDKDTSVEAERLRKLRAEADIVEAKAREFNDTDTNGLTIEIKRSDRRDLPNEDNN